MVCLSCSAFLMIGFGLNLCYQIGGAFSPPPRLMGNHQEIWLNHTYACGRARGLSLESERQSTHSGEGGVLVSRRRTMRSIAGLQDEDGSVPGLSEALRKHGADRVRTVARPSSLFSASLTSFALSLPNARASLVFIRPSSSKAMTSAHVSGIRASGRLLITLAAML